jgi:hypothetical protein
LPGWRAAGGGEGQIFARRFMRPAQLDVGDVMRDRRHERLNRSDRMANFTPGLAGELQGWLLNW